MRLDDLRAEYDKALKSLEAAKKTGDSAAIKAAKRACDIAFANFDEEERRFTILREVHDKDPPRQSRAGGPI